MAAPCVLVTSCSDLASKEIVRRVIGVEELQNGMPVVEEIVAYPWHVNTKYYTADIHLCTTNARTIGNEEFAESVQAFIVHFNPNQKSSLDQVKMWLPFLKEIEPVIQLLVCDRCNEGDAVSKLAVQSWCLDNSFELVELDPAVDSDSDSEDDFKETTGIPRVIQALHAHTWPNLTMKEHPDFRSAYMNKMMAEEAKNREIQLQNTESEASLELKTSNSSESNHESENVSKDSNYSQKRTEMTETHTDGAKNVVDTVSHAKLDSACEEKDSVVVKSDKKQSKAEKQDAGFPDSLIKDDDLSLFAAVGNDDPDGESFEQLFERMKIMKETAASLPPDQRKLYAEQVAISFWRAIGGDEEEIEGLSDSDEE